MMVIIRTLTIGILGALGALWLGVPSPWLLGPVLAVALVALRGVPVAMPRITNTLVSLFVGLSVAFSIDASLLEHLHLWGASIALLSLMLLLLLVVLYRYYRRLPDWSALDALFCAVPGNLAILLTLAADTPANMRRLALVHSIRLSFLVVLLPIFFPLAEREPSGDWFLIQDAEKLLLAALLGWGLGHGLARIRCPAAMLFGGLGAGILLKQFMGWQGGLPDLLLCAMLVVLGCNVGARFNVVRFSQVVPELRASVGGLLLTLLISGLFAGVLWRVFDVPLIQALLAYAPGGIEVMLAIAMNQPVDTVFVATHQVFRMLLMGLLVPLLLGWLSRRA